MAAATVNIPAIALSVGPMLNGWHKGERTGSGTIVWKAREMLSAGEIDYDEFMDLVASSAPSTGYCNTMGTATTMNSLAEALGMQLPGSAAIPAPYRERGQMAYETGKRIVEMVHEDLKPSDIMTREAFENAIVVNSAIGGSTNAPIHLNAIARHLGVPLDNDDWQKIGHEIPLLVNLQPAGEYLGEDYHHAGGVPAVVAELMKAGLLPNPEALTVNGKTIGDNCKAVENLDRDVIRTVAKPLKAHAGFINLKGNLFDSAIMKTSVISPEFRDRYLSNPKDPEAFEGKAMVFDGPEDYHARIDDPALGIDEHTILFMRGAGPVGYPGARRGRQHAAAGLPDQEGHPRAALHRRRPPVGHVGLAVDPQRLAGSGGRRRAGAAQDRRPRPHRPRQGHRRHPDLRRGTGQAPRRAAAAMAATTIRKHQTPWQEIQRGMVDQLGAGHGAEAGGEIPATSRRPAACRATITEPSG